MRHYEIVIPLTGTALEKNNNPAFACMHYVSVQVQSGYSLGVFYFRFHEKFLMQFEIKKPSLMHIYQAGGRIWIHVYMDVQKLSSNHNCLHFREVRYV